MEYKYRTNFKLTDNIKPGTLEEANNYLREDNMEFYFNSPDEHPNLKEKIVSIYFLLLNEEGYGHVEVITRELLSEKELKSISEYISGQCSDGLGEGFEQQDFANFYDKEYDYDVRTSFDWETNNYKLILYED